MLSHSGMLVVVFIYSNVVPLLAVVGVNINIVPFHTANFGVYSNVASLSIVSMLVSSRVLSPLRLVTEVGVYSNVAPLSIVLMLVSSRVLSPLRLVTEVGVYSNVILTLEFSVN